MADVEMTEEDFMACNALGGDEAVWDGVAAEIGLRWRGPDVNAAIVFGFAEIPSDVQE